MLGFQSIGVLVLGEQLRGEVLIGGGRRYVYTLEALRREAASTLGKKGANIRWH
jgi:hypothetical protein